MVWIRLVSLFQIFIPRPDFIFLFSELCAFQTTASLIHCRLGLVIYRFGTSKIMVISLVLKTSGEAE